MTPAAPTPAPSPDDILAAHGADDRVRTLHRSAATAELPLGRVSRVDRDRCHLVTAGGPTTATADDLPAVGDWVTVAESDAGADVPHRVAEVLPRWSTLVRHAAGDAAQAQVIAADVDVVLLVHGLDRPVNLSRLERELVVAWDTGAQPVIVLTKADAVQAADVAEVTGVAIDPDDTDPDGAADPIEALVDTVQRRTGGVDVIVTSIDTGRGLDELVALLRPSRTAVLLGPSGVGKSSLVNALLGGDVQATGDVRSGDHKGRHTTTARFLLPVPGGGVLLDTPGIRAVGLWDVEEGMALAFADIERLAEQCRFSDCAHTGEPGCAVAAAVTAGDLDAGRLVSYHKLHAEAARVERSRDARAVAEERRKGRAIHKAMRDMPPKR